MSKLKQEITKERVLIALSSVFDGSSGVDVVSSGMISSIFIKKQSVGFAIEIDMNQAAEKELLRRQCEKAVRDIEGVDRVTAVLTSQSSDPVVQKKEPEMNTDTLPTVAAKSTVAVNLTRSLAKMGYKAAIADLDIYGPSVPKMLGLSGKPDVNEQNKMIPKESNGIKSVSIGYLVDEDNAVVWRSSMALKAMNQLMRGVVWGEVDYLIVDTPPGTGDIQLSLVKNFAVDGAVLVSTPQDVALADVKKAASMFDKLQLPILGIVENMSYFEDSACKKNYIFGEGGAKRFAKESGIEFLGEIPLRTEIRESADNGVAPQDTSPMDAIALKMKKQLEKKL